jgi:hypothetical protein
MSSVTRTRLPVRWDRGRSPRQEWRRNHADPASGRTKDMGRSIESPPCLEEPSRRALLPTMASSFSAAAISHPPWDRIGVVIRRHLGTQQVHGPRDPSAKSEDTLSPVTHAMIVLTGVIRRR